MFFRVTPTPFIVTLFGIILLGFAWVSLAQAGFFQRNDLYDFRGLHSFSVNGPDPDNLFPKFDSPADFLTFKIRLKAGSNLGPSPGGPWWWLNKIEVDVNNDGTFEATTTGATTFQHTFAAPPDGVKSTHDVAFKLQFIAPGGGATTRTVVHTVTSYAAPRVYVNDNGDMLVQPRNQDPNGRKPILVVEGIDPANQGFPDVYYHQLAQVANDVLYPGGFELFVLNFHEGGRSLRQNADVLLEALDAIHGLSPTKRIAVVGISMGGVVSRYALAKAESEGLPHHVGLFISYDSPQKEAHLNRGLQDDIRTAEVSNAGVEALRSVLQTPAALEMLGYNTYNPTGLIHNQFYTDLNALNGNGYPHESYNAAISNGNYYATWPVELVGEDLATLKLYTDGIWGSGESFTIHAVSEATDCATGSKGDLARKQAGPLPLARWLSWPPIPAFFGAHFEFQIQFDPVYMPTWSTLDLVGHGVDNGTGHINPPGVSKFDATYFQPTPVYHGATNEGTVQQILQWLGKTSTITIDYQLAEGGSVSPDAYVINVLDMMPITVAPRTVTLPDGRQITYKFSHWDDGSTQNPRSLYASHNLTRTVTMKGHLVTTSSGTAWTSSERRIAEGVDNVGPTYHAVYESDGSIWYLRNMHGAGWEQERRLSDGNVGGTSLTVLTQSFAAGIAVSVAWPGLNGEMVYRASGFDNGMTWLPSVQHSGGCNPSGIVLTDPGCEWVPGGHDPCWPTLLFADLGCPGLPGYEGIWYIKQPQTVGCEAHLVPGTENATNPAASYAGDCGHGYGYGYHLAFIRDNKVYLSGFWDPMLDVTAIAPQACGSEIDLTTPGWSATNPSIVTNGGTVFVAWEESNGTTRRIAFKQRTGSSWSSPVYFTHSSDIPTKPVLGIDLSCSKVNLLWQCGDHVARVSRPLSGSTWTPLENMGFGRAPSITTSAAYGSTAMKTSETATPYAINFWGVQCSSGGGGGGCPFVDTRTPSGWVVENSILGRSATGALESDPYQLVSTPEIARGKVSLRIRENERERTTLDRVQLTAIDHPVGSTVFRLGGRFVTGTLSSAHRVVDSHGTDLTSQLGGGGVYTGAPGETLYVEMTDPSALRSGDAIADNAGPSAGVEGGGGGGYMNGFGKDLEPELRYQPVLDAAASSNDVEVLNGTGIILAVGDDRGGWRDVKRWYPRQYGAECTLDSLDGRPLRLSFVGRHSLRFVGQLGSMVPAPTPQVLGLISASHSRLGVTTAALNAEGGATTTLASGDTISLEFAASEVPAGKTRTYFLITRGVYTTTGVEPEGTPVAALPTGFALSSNHPNPFARTTTIRFELPQATHVRLEVFDLMGRRVRSLENRLLSPGYQSVEWDRRDDAGNRVGAGVYLYRMLAGSFRAEKKMVLLGN